MTQGIVIFAYNNELIDYVAMAAWSAGNIHRHLGLPVCVVTDVTDLPAHYEFDQVVSTSKESEYSRHFADLNDSVTWYNKNRMDAYRLSPWDQTLVLDADYVVAGNQLAVLFDSGQDFLAHERAYDVTGCESFDSNNTFGQYHVPMNWATVMYFDRNQHAELIFDTMHMIRDNWPHYRDLYGIASATYRNDYALTIAQLVTNGHVLGWPTIPWPLASVTPSPRVSQLAQDQYRVDYQNSQGLARWITVGQDLHVMGKSHLGAIVANSR